MRHQTTKLPSQDAKSAEHFLDQRHRRLILRQAPYAIVELKACSWEDVLTAIFKHGETLKDRNRQHTLCHRLSSSKIILTTFHFLDHSHTYLQLPFPFSFPIVMGRQVRTTPKELGLVAIHWMGSGVADWLPALPIMCHFPLHQTVTRM